jgi:putative transposase
MADRPSGIRDIERSSRMPNYHRFRVPGGTYFFTINLLDRRSDLLVRHVDALRGAVRLTRLQRPFRIDAWVVLPDHMHCIITLAPGDDDFSNRIKAIKIRFARAVPPTESRTGVRIARGERGIWQRRFWEHMIRDDIAYARHMDYVHFNPVKHCHVASVRDWPFSTFHRLAKAGLYPSDWGGANVEDLCAGEAS